jgi:hypothetical protein
MKPHFLTFDRTECVGPAQPKLVPNRTGFLISEMEK